MQENIGTRTKLHGPNHYCSRELCSTLYFVLWQSWHMNFPPSATASSVVLVVLAVRAALHIGLLKQSITTPQYQHQQPLLSPSPPQHPKI